MTHFIPHTCVVRGAWHVQPTRSPVPIPSYNQPAPEAVPDMKSLGPEHQSSVPVLERRSQKILILSKDHDFCSLLRSYLESSGLFVFTCSAPDRGEAILANHCEISLSLIDVQSVGIAGIFFAMRLQESRPEIPIMVVEGARADETVLSGFLSDSWTRARKTIALPNLLSTIHRLLASGTCIRRSKSTGRSGEEPPAARPADEFRSSRFIDASFFQLSKSQN
jgi:CheY-like chemotaxis protein